MHALAAAKATWFLPLPAHVHRSTLQKECVSISKQLFAGQGSGNCRSGQVVRWSSVTAAAATVAVADSTAAVCEVVNVDSDVENLIWGDFDSRTVTVQAQTSPQTEAILQVRQYIEEPFIGRRENPLAWWFARVKVYPRLSKLALRNFCMVATSLTLLCSQMLT